MTKITLHSVSAGSSTSLIQKAFDKCGTKAGKNLAYSEVEFSEGTYWINSRLYLNSNTKFSCNGNVIFKLLPNLSTSVFGLQVPVIGQREDTIYGLDISGICFDGNYKNQKNTTGEYGKGYFNFIGLKDVADSKFHDFSGGYNEGDYFRLTEGSNLEIYNNSCEFGGHDHIHLSKCDYVKVHDNFTKMRANNAIRLRSCHYIEVYNNTTQGTNLAFAPAFQIENIDPKLTSYGIECHHNKIIDTYGPGIWFLSNLKNSYDLHIHHNTILRCGQMPASNKISGVGGIVGDGWNQVVIENNVINSCYGYGVAIAKYLSVSPIRGLSVSVKGNTITNTKKAYYAGTSSGCPIANVLGSKTKVTADNNCFWNNAISKCFGLISTNEIREDPELEQKKEVVNDVPVS